ncbi:MAG: ECF transporter S component [Lachnospiraceae bacterium]|nr:ECF transporter S component [Lachnospiraceae bacterium]
MNNKTKKMVIAALMTAFTCIATMIIKIPTPTFGYIHLGDGLVLLCGILLGPLYGAFAAGAGSMFSDIFSGYASWAAATFIIKSLTAGTAGILFKRICKTAHQTDSTRNRNIRVIAGGSIGELIMVTGYFLYETGLAAFASGGFTTAAIAAGATASAAGIPFNIAQGVVGILICLVLLPVLQKIPDVRNMLSD